MLGCEARKAVAASETGSRCERCASALHSGTAPATVSEFQANRIEPLRVQRGKAVAGICRSLIWRCARESGDRPDTTRRLLSRRANGVGIPAP